MKTGMLRTVVVDVETTGLSVRHYGRVIEVGAVALENGIVVAELDTLIYTGAPISNGAYRVWDISTKPYLPKLAKGDRLAFKLRANPVQSSKQERTAEELEAWQKSRAERGLKQNRWTEKVIRHDVVMEAKTKIDFKKLPEEKRPHVATLIQEAGLEWLKTRENEYGFSVVPSGTRADGYCQHKLFKGKGAKPVTFSTLEFDGILTVTEPDSFIEKCLFDGIGPAKGFGCGLMLVRRV